MLNLVLFGPPGSGKGTQSELIINKYRLVHLSTGDILRSEMARGTPLGLKAKDYMAKGELVPDRDVIEMIAQRIDGEASGEGYIFDGFPRTREQARFLRNMLTERETRIDLMISLEVPEEELIHRLVKRGQASGRADDELPVIKNRIEVYNKQTAPVIDFYRKMRTYTAVDGVGSIEEIFGRIVEKIEKVKNFII